MPTGRTLQIFEKVYLDGYDLTGYMMDTGEQGVDFNPVATLTFGDAIQGYFPTKPTVTLGPIQGVFDNTALVGLHTVGALTQGAKRNVMLAYGIRGAPAMGSETFCAPMLQAQYNGVGTAVVTAKIVFDNLDQNSALVYNKFWGKLLHTLASETGANAANTNVDNGAATTAGGWMMWQILSITGSGTVTVSIDDSANGTSWAALSGATSGAITTASAPTSGIVQLATGATVREYLRWQFALGGSATAASFVLAFMRG